MEELTAILTPFTAITLQIKKGRSKFTLMEKQIQIQLIDPFDVLLCNIEHQLELWAKDSDPNRIDSVLKLEVKVLELEVSFRTNYN